MHDETGKADQDDAGGDGAHLGNVQGPPLVTVPLGAQHRLGDFKCERSQRVCDFLKNDHPELVRQNYCRVFILPDHGDSGRVLGFYTLSASAVKRDLVGSQLQKKLPGGIPIPVAIIGFMGRDDTAPKGTGGILIQDAARRVSQISDIGIWGLMLDAESEELATKFYDKAGFKRARPEVKGGSPSLVMYGPVKTFLPEL